MKQGWDSYVAVGLRVLVLVEAAPMSEYVIVSYVAVVLVYFNLN